MFDTMYHENLSMQGRYEVMDPVKGRPRPMGGIGVIGLAAKWTGKQRPPLKGEWYISGAIPQAYRAVNNLKVSFPIAKLVRVERVVSFVETPFIEGL